MEPGSPLHADALMTCLAQCEDDCDNVLLELRPFVQTVARNILRKLRLTGQLHDHLLGEALTLVWEKRKQFEPGKRFYPWFRVVFQNYTLTELRGKSRASAKIQHSNLDSIPSPISERPIDEPLGDGDLEKIAKWPNKDRLVLLVISNLWWRLPDNLWEGWISDPNPGVTPPYPPHALTSCEDHTERAHVVAVAFGCPVGVIQQRWHRGIKKLRELECLESWRSERIL